jgi:hypothetical protein
MNGPGRLLRGELTGPFPTNQGHTFPDIEVGTSTGNSLTTEDTEEKTISSVVLRVLRDLCG